LRRGATASALATVASDRLRLVSTGGSGRLDRLRLIDTSRGVLCRPDTHDHGGGRVLCRSGAHDQGSRCLSRSRSANLGKKLLLKQHFLA
jgi:hypothetical protein